MDSKYNYIVVLFKNNEKKKIIKKFVTRDRALNFYEELINKIPIFGKRVENGKLCSFELGLVEKSNLNTSDKYFIRDDFGRNLKVNLDNPDYKITRLEPYEVEELLYDLQKNKRISMLEFIKTYLQKNKIKLISKLNNKVIVQVDDVFNLF